MRVPGGLNNRRRVLSQRDQRAGWGVSGRAGATGAAARPTGRLFVRLGKGRVIGNSWETEPLAYGPTMARELGC